MDSAIARESSETPEASSRRSRNHRVGTSKTDSSAATQVVQFNAGTSVGASQDEFDCTKLFESLDGTPGQAAGAELVDRGDAVLACEELMCTRRELCHGAPSESWIGRRESAKQDYVRAAALDTGSGQFEGNGCLRMSEIPASRDSAHRLGWPNLVGVRR